MSDDLLSRATRALREETAGGDDGREDILARIERSQVASSFLRRSRLRAATFVLAAALFGVGALAAVTGRVSDLAARVAELASSFGAERGEAPARRSGTVRTAAPASPAPKVASSNASPSAAAPPSGEAALIPDAGNLRRLASARAAARRAPSPRAATEPADVDALYRTAHELHFSRRDYAAALAAWDRYLAAAGPDSRMLIEARYNRGIALARLGRREDAMRALQPFADGEYGQYRRDDALRVIDKLTQ